MGHIRLGKYNRLTVLRKVDFGVYLDGEDDGDIHLYRGRRGARLSLLPEPRLHRNFLKKRTRDADAQNPLRPYLRHRPCLIRIDGDQLFLRALQGRQIRS